MAENYSLEKSFERAERRSYDDGVIPVHVGKTRGTRWNSTLEFGAKTNSFVEVLDF